MAFDGLPPKRKIFLRLSIFAGNCLQIAGLLAGGWALFVAHTLASPALAFTTMLAGWLLFYFFCHGIAHWLVGRLLGIRFLHYSVGGAANPQSWPPGVRWVFEHLPFFGVQTEKASMQAASGAAKAIMWSSGVTSSAVVPALGAYWAWRSGVPHAKVFFLFSVFWGLGALASNWTSPTGDFAKAKRALSSQ